MKPASDPSLPPGEKWKTFLTGLTLAIALALIVVAAAFLPVVQTWIVEQALARHPGLQASVGSVSAGLSSVHISNLRLQHDGAVLTLPILEVGLPLKTALWDRKVLIQSLVAKGWTLDLSRRSARGGEEARGSGVASPTGGGGLTAPAEASSVSQVGPVLRGLLGGGELPCETSLEGVDLDGDVLIATPAGKEPTRVHVTVRGGGLTAGHEGDFALAAAGPMVGSRLLPHAAAAQGRLVVALGTSPRSIHRIEFKGSLSSPGGALPDDLTVAARVVAADHAAAESYTLLLSRGRRHLANVSASLEPATRRLAGTWKVDLQDSDWARFYPGRPLPSLATTGEGSLDADPALTRVRVNGSLHAAVDRLGAVAPALERLGAATLEVGFDLVRSTSSIQVDRLSVAVGGARPIAVAHARQPFSLELSSGALKVADPGADWLEGSLQGLPMVWLTGLVGGLEFAGGEASGDFVVQAAHSGVTLRTKTPLVANGVSVQRAGRKLGQGLNLSLALVAEHTPQGWQLQATPLTLSTAGRYLATLEAKISPLAGAGRRLAMAGTWKADLEALAAQSAIPGIDAIKGRAASGDFTLSVGTAVDVKGKVHMIGHDPGHSLTANVRAYVDAHGGVSFHVPVTITQGSGTSEFSADGTWSKAGAGPRVNVELSAVNVALEHLKPLAASLAAAGGVAWPAFPPAGDIGPAIVAGRRDPYPFWGDWTGRVKLDFYRLRAAAHELHEVTATFGVDHGALRLERGRGVLTQQSPTGADRSPRLAKSNPARSVVTAEGALAFEAAAEFPYSVTATAAIDGVDAARFFTAAQAEQGPVVEGHFSVVATLTGNGNNLADLVDRRREEFRLLSKGGILRLLKTSVAESIPETPTPVSDALANVGSVFGTLLGIKRDPLSTGMNHLSKATEAVLNFTYQTPEIRYDQLTLTAIRGSDHTIRLAEIAMSAPNERLTGSGQITYAKGLPLRAQPIALELRFGARGRTAALLSTAGVLSSDKDEQGYMLLPQAIHFGGTLEQIDNSQWRDVLVRAATPKPDRGKKGG